MRIVTAAVAVALFFLGLGGCAAFLGMVIFGPETPLAYASTQEVWSNLTTQPPYSEVISCVIAWGLFLFVLILIGCAIALFIQAAADVPHFDKSDAPPWPKFIDAGADKQGSPSLYYGCRYNTDSFSGSPPATNDDVPGTNNISSTGIVTGEIPDANIPTDRTEP